MQKKVLQISKIFLRELYKLYFHVLGIDFRTNKSDNFCVGLYICAEDICCYIHKCAVIVLKHLAQKSALQSLFKFL